MDDYRFSVMVRRNGNGWVAVCPEFEGSEVRGGTHDEAVANIREWLAVRIEDCIADDEDVPQAETVSFTTLRLSA